MPNDELITILDDEDSPAPALRPWPILVVDDDEEIHAVTRIALANFKFRGRPLAMESCYSAREAYDYLSRRRDIACVLLDVVMEDEHAGLNLVRRIREELNNHQLRIVLRTGQPGYAPEIEVIQSYDINDYKSKTELTVTRLMSTVITALRSYEQLTTIDEHNRGLELVIRSSADLFSERNVKEFAAGVVTQLAAQIGVEPEGVLCTSMEGDDLMVVAGAGRFSPFVNRPLTGLGLSSIEQMIRRAMDERRHVRGDDCTVFFLESTTAPPAVVYVQGAAEDIGGHQKVMLQLFCMNMALGFETAQLFEQLKAMAYVNPMTRLPNRAGLVQAIGQSPEDQPVLVAMLDIDEFHAVTGHLGFHAGDHLIRATAQRLRAAFPDALSLAHITSDQFALALASDDVRLLNERVGEAFDLPLSVQGMNISVGITGGCAFLPPGPPRDGETLAREATRAMKEAKRRMRGQVVAFDSNLERQSNHHLVLISDLRRAVKGEEILLHYQPKIRLEDGRCCGVEALVRWDSPIDGLLYPSAFVPSAEVSGLIVPLGRRIFELALRQSRLWTSRGLDMPIAVNVSAVQIQHADFMIEIDALLAETGVDPRVIEIEITETSLLADDDRVFANLNGLRDRGFGLTLDDFGTGYSSLSHLNLLPLTTLKIDRSFVSTITETGRSAVLVAAMVGVARSMDMKVVAEGVETEAQEIKLTELGVDIVQGFLHGRGMTPNEFEAWLAVRQQRLSEMP